ncbi:MAG: hypothetical protein RIM84_21055 [Alphaproteobacteria bacterium]
MRWAARAATAIGSASMTIMPISPSAAQDDGRYQLTTGPMLAVEPISVPLPEKTVFLLDTRTGQSWMLMYAPMGIRLEPYWVELPPVPSAEQGGPEK